MLYVVKKDGPIRMNPPTVSQQLVFWLGKVRRRGGVGRAPATCSPCGVRVCQVFFVLYRFVVPALYMDLWRVLVLFAVADAVSSYWLAILFQANHVVGEVSWPVPDKDGRIHHDWAAMQVRASAPLTLWRRRGSPRAL
jgi:hypothetical protein